MVAFVLFLRGGVCVFNRDPHMYVTYVVYLRVGGTLMQMMHVCLWFFYIYSHE